MNKIRTRVEEYELEPRVSRALETFLETTSKNQDNVDYHRYYPRINLNMLN